MKYGLQFIRCIVLVCLLHICLVSCSNNGSVSNTTSADTTIKGMMPKMSARERLAKNNILERHPNTVSMHLLGRVKIFSQTTYKISDKMEQVMDRKNVDSFDEKGNNVESRYVHMENGKITEWKSIMKLDTSGNDTVRESYGTDGKITHKAISSYDARGNETGNVSYDANGKEEDRDRYKYDSYDNLIELDFGTRGGKWVYQYDANGFVSQGETIDAAGSLESKHTRKYDTSGNELATIMYNKDGSIDEIDSFKHDDKGHLTEFAQYTADAKFKSRETMKYDDKGHETETIIYKNNGSIDADKCLHYENVYDATGNITKQTTFKMKSGKQVPTEITESEYVYY